MKNIVYIDDSVLEAVLIERVVSFEGHRCQIFFTTAFVNNYLEKTMVKPDLFICDFNGTSILAVQEDLRSVKNLIITSSLDPEYLDLSDEFKFVSKQKLVKFLKDFLDE